MARRGVLADNPLVETLLLFAIVYALQQLAAYAGAGVVASLFVLSQPLETDPWTIVTSVYAHANLAHLVSNSVALVVVGLPIALSTSRVRFHTFFVTTGAIAGVSQVVIAEFVLSLASEGGLAAQFVAPVVGDGTGVPAVLGASGAVFALMGYFLTSNRLAEGIAGLVSVPLWVSVGTFLVLAAVVTYATASPQAALIAHFAGFFLGLIAGRARVLRV